MPRRVLVLFTLSVLTLALGGCSAATAEDSASAASQGALGSFGRLLVTQGDDAGLELRFGIGDASQKSSTVTIRRDGFKRTFKCDATMDLQREPASEKVSYSCSPNGGGYGYGGCSLALSRAGNSTFLATATCSSYSGYGGGASSLSAEDAATYTALTGEPAPSSTYAKKDIKLIEREAPSDMFHDLIAFTEALVDPIRPLLLKKQFVDDSATRSAREIEVTRVTAHPNVADRTVDLTIYATSYRAQADDISVEDDTGAIAPSSEIVARAVASAKCADGPLDQPNCMR